MNDCKWTAFYEPFFKSRLEVEEFVARCEATQPPANRAKLIMHQGQRLVTLADDIPNLRPSAEGLQLLFLLTCAEHVAKLYDDYDGEGRSRSYTQKFFSDHVPAASGAILALGFGIEAPPPMGERMLSLTEAVDLLYKIRCEVVHEGRFWQFPFQTDMALSLVERPEITVYLRYTELKAAVSLGVIAAAQALL